MLKRADFPLFFIFILPTLFHNNPLVHESTQTGIFTKGLDENKDEQVLEGWS